MTSKPLIVLSLFILSCMWPAAARACESGHWIETISDDGEIIKLEDGSVWEVDSVDTVDTALWLATSNIVVCGSSLINTDDNETAEAQRIR